MRTHLTLTVTTFLCTLLLTATAAGEGCRVMVLREDDGEVVLEAVPLEEGEPRVFGQEEIITVVLPVGVGMSGDVIQASSRSSSIVVVCEDGIIRTSVTAPDGSARPLPDVALADAEALDLRVNVTPGEGDRCAFLVRGYETVLPADGPVVDMFGGAIPISAGEFSITTEVSPAAERTGVSGIIPMRVSDGFLIVEGLEAGGAAGSFVVDFGAGGTVVTRGFLPENAEIDPLLAIEYSPSGERVLPGVMTGAGGEVEGFLGAAVLHELTLGEVVLPHLSVGVIAEMPAWGGEPIVGILGLDVLDRAGVASLTIRQDGSGRLELLPSGAPVPEGGIELPFTVAAEHIFIAGTIGETPVNYMFDTGARSTIVPLGIADAAGLSDGSLPDREFRGLDGGVLPARSVRADGFTLHGVPFPEFDIYAADLPVLEGLGLDEGSGLLGIDFILGFDRVDVDFTDGVLRLWREEP